MMQDETLLLHNKTQNKTINRFNQEKLYIQLTRIFLEEINSGEWKLKQQIPTIDEGIPVLVIHRLFLSSDGIPVAYTRLMGRSYKYKFQTEFERIR
jgi:DNA-binding GntR family transcriptional regulator